MSSETTLLRQRLVNRRGLRPGMSNETPSSIPLHGGDEEDDSGMLSDSSSEGAASPPPVSCLDELPAVQRGQSPQSTDEWSFSSNHSETSTEQHTPRYLTPSRISDHGQPPTPLSAKRKAAPFSVKGYTPERPYITQRAGFRSISVSGRSQNDGLPSSSSHLSPSQHRSQSLISDNVKENNQNPGAPLVLGRSASSHSLDRPEHSEAPTKRSRVKPLELDDAIDSNEAKRSVEIIRRNGLPPLPTSLTEFLQQHSSKNSPSSKSPSLPSNPPSNSELPLSTRDLNKAASLPRFVQPPLDDKKPTADDDVFKRPADIDFRARRNTEDQKENRDPIYPSISIFTGSSPFGREVMVNNLRYTVLKEIGRGGTGTVYEVLSHRHEEKFALKCISIKNAEQQTEQNYINEIKLLRRLDKHDRIVRLWDYEVNRQQQIIYMVLEMGTIDFAHLLANQKGRPLNYHFIKLYWEQMLEAVEAIHQQKIVHSDLKPANFILVDGSLKLIDFGIAKAISNDTTNIHREQQVGTINYMSPEAFIQETDNLNGRHFIKHGRPSDVWSLGCILYQMVYGYTPFHHLTTVLQKIAAITGPKFQVPFPSEIRDQGTLVTIDPSLHEVLQSCLQRDPRARMTIPQLLQHHSLRPKPPTEKKAALDSLIQRAYELGMMGRSLKDDANIERMSKDILGL